MSDSSLVFYSLLYDHGFRPVSINSFGSNSLASTIRLYYFTITENMRFRV